MSEWLAVEAIVRQRDKENTAASIAKLSSESTSGDAVPPPLQRDLSNDVREPTRVRILVQFSLFYIGRGVSGIRRCAHG